MPVRLCLLACLPALMSTVVGKPTWATDLEATMQRAKKDDRPVFVVFRCDH